MSSRRVLTPTQSCQHISDSTAPDDQPKPVTAVAFKVQTSRSLRWMNTPLYDSPNLSRIEEDTTLCFASRPSEGDLTACASASSGLKFKNESRSTPPPSSFELLLAELPEIPDWYEDYPEQAEEKQEETPAIPTPTIYTPTLDTPLSDYHSLADYHPTSLCCQDFLPELGQCQHAASCTVSPEISNCMIKNAEGPQTMPQHVAALRPWSPQNIRRSYSFDLGTHRTFDYPYVVSSFLIPPL
ncbi:hypothetical protein R3P38DRAFT_2889617 [Favolaschia claudopus]|uniref:Uncharacterized protein n=1 Tax=Favolaschia claudopus TaxID=2862362 RepID=A0AAW0CU24_9AGAR